MPKDLGRQSRSFLIDPFSSYQKRLGRHFINEWHDIDRGPTNQSNIINNIWVTNGTTMSYQKTYLFFVNHLFKYVKKNRNTKWYDNVVPKTYLFFVNHLFKYVNFFQNSKWYDNVVPKV